MFITAPKEVLPIAWELWFQAVELFRQRFAIGALLGCLIARAMEYIHEKCPPCVSNFS